MVVCADARKSTAESLQDQGNDVDGDEDPVEELGLDSGDGGVNEVDAVVG